MDIGDVINGWRIVEDAGAGRSGHVFIVCREGDPDRLFALKMQRTDRPDVAPDANAREAALLRAGMNLSVSCCWRCSVTGLSSVVSRRVTGAN